MLSDRTWGRGVREGRGNGEEGRRETEESSKQAVLQKELSKGCRRIDQGNLITQDEENQKENLNQKKEVRPPDYLLGEETTGGPSTQQLLKPPPKRRKTHYDAGHKSRTISGLEGATGKILKPSARPHLRRREEARSGKPKAKRTKDLRTTQL